jgi:hypothetical protein
MGLSPAPPDVSDLRAIRRENAATLREASQRLRAERETERIAEDQARKAVRRRRRKTK